MSTSFAQLFRASKFATYDPLLKQVYTTSGAAKKNGEWGLKRNLPQTWRAPVITVGAMDTAERQTPFDSALNQVLFLKRWNANFGNNSKRNWEGFNADRVKYLSKMSNEEFSVLLKDAKAKRKEWQNAYGNSTHVPNLEKFLNISTDNSSNTLQAPPMYRSTENEKNAVQGRVLNVNSNFGYSIGINGVVATVAKAEANYYSQNKSYYNSRSGEINPYNHELRQFYIQEAYFTPEGKPRVTLTLKKVSGTLQNHSTGNQLNAQLSGIFNIAKSNKDSFHFTGVKKSINNETSFLKSSFKPFSKNNSLDKSEANNSTLQESKREAFFNSSIFSGLQKNEKK